MAQNTREQLISAMQNFLEDNHINFSNFIPADEVKYDENVIDFLIECTGYAIAYDKHNEDHVNLMKAFGVEDENIAMFRHLRVECLGYTEVVLYYTEDNKRIWSDWKTFIEDFTLIEEVDLELFGVEDLSWME